MALTKVSYSLISSAPISVLDYGAVGDGVTNDAPAVQAAINAVNAVGNGTVIFPAGRTYFLNSQINLCDDLTLTGYGAKLIAGRGYATVSTPLFKTFTGVSPATPLVQTATKNITILGLDIDGNDSGTPGVLVPNADMHGSLICLGDWSGAGITNAKIKDCNFTNFEGIAVLVYESTGVGVIGNYFENMFANATLSSGSAITFATVNGGLIANNILNHTSSGLSWHGMVINDRSTGSRNISVTGNVIRNMNGGDGISCEGNAVGPNNLDNCVFSGNVIENCVGEGIGVDKCVSVTVTGNTIKDVTGIGIDISDTTTAVINGNNIVGCGSGIWTNGNSTRIVISGNRIEDTTYISANYQGEAIFISNSPSDSSMSVEITGNDLKNIDGCGIFCSNRALVSGNYIYNPGRSATATRDFGIWAVGQVLGNTVVGASANSSFGILLGVNISVTNNNVSGTFGDGFYKIGTRAGTLDQFVNYTALQYDGTLDRMTVWASAAPSTGGWYVGDIVYNTVPTAGGNIGWVCTTSGFSGTWRTWGAIA